ncbi:MAG: phytoene desaturase family protein [Anaerolineae bacterium]
MAERRKVVVVGAGLGGIAAAGRLARSGYDVVVLEKNAGPGGRCGQLVQDGHRFDIGPTLFLMPEIFEETYAALGERMEDHLDLVRIDPTYRVRFGDGYQLQLTSNLYEMQEQLEACETGSFEALMRYLAEGYRNYHKSIKYFVGRNFYNILEYFSPKNFPLLFELKALVKHYDSVARYFKDPHLRAAFTFQDMYLGLSPYEALATYSLLQYTEMVNGVWFPMGGLYRAIETLTSIVESQGVTFRYKAPVARILVDGKRTTGVELADGERIPADLVVANADLPYVYEELLPRDEAAIRRLNNLKYTCATLMFYWGVDKVYSQIEHHNVFLSTDYKGSFDRIFNEHGMPDDISFYVHAPARTDPAAAPAGEDTLLVLVPVGHLSDAVEQDWDAMTEQARATVFSRLAELGVADLEDHIKFEVVYTAHTWQKLFNLAKGAAFGLSHNFFQVGYLRPQNRHRRYKNLYFVGASTHPGTGLPIVLLSARLTTERILKEIGS